MSFEKKTLAKPLSCRRNCFVQFIEDDPCILTSRSGQNTKFYMDLEEDCKRRAAKEVSELQVGDQRTNDEIRSQNDQQKIAMRLPRYLKEENIARIESYLSEYYKETVYQKLWQNAQNAVFGNSSCVVKD